MNNRAINIHALNQQLLGLVVRDYGLALIELDPNLAGHLLGMRGQQWRPWRGHACRLIAGHGYRLYSSERFRYIYRIRVDVSMLLVRSNLDV